MHDMYKFQNVKYVSECKVKMFYKTGNGMITLKNGSVLMMPNCKSDISIMHIGSIRIHGPFEITPEVL